MPHYQVRQPPPAQSTSLAPIDRALLKDTMEVPVAAPVFEGHLYLRTQSKRWQWRLFRFDGTSFTCLSTRKVKLPPDTPVTVPNQDLVCSQLNGSPSINTSLTSPLLATPKDKSLRLTHRSMPNLAAADEPPMMANYYQLPKWTVDVSNISAISVLKRSKKRSPFSPSKSKCFCIRTLDGQCYIMKAANHKELERWLFVLTKMWKFAQTIRKQLLSQQSALVPQQQQQQQQRTTIPQTQQHRIADDEDDAPVMRSLVPPAPPRHVQKAQPAPISVTQHPTPPIPPQPQQPASPYDTLYKPPTLNAEKTQWIDEWRRSLAQLAASGANINMTPPPIESIPDDDNVSSLSGFTSISARERPPKKVSSTTMPLRKPSKRSLRSSSTRRGGGSGGGGSGGGAKSNLIAPADASSTAILPTHELPLDDRPSSSLKKKRSDEVKNWISSSRGGAGGATTDHGPEENDAGSPDRCNLEYFQDVQTVMNDDEMERTRSLQGASVRYHTSVRGRNIQIVDSSKAYDKASIPQKSTTQQRASMIVDVHAASPLQTIVQSQLRLRDEEKIDDEDMSLADLQKSLRRVSMYDRPLDSLHSSNQHVRTPSASSILDRAAPIPPPHHTPSPIVAPAVPPVPLRGGGGGFHTAYFVPPMMESKSATQPKRSRHSFVGWGDKTPRPQSYFEQMNMFATKSSSTHQQIRQPLVESQRYI